MAELKERDSMKCRSCAIASTSTIAPIRSWPTPRLMLARECGAGHSFSSTSTERSRVPSGARQSKVTFGATICSRRSTISKTRTSPRRCAPSIYPFPRFGPRNRVGADLRALGMAVGHASDNIGATGVTVIRGIDKAFRAGCALLGRATGTRELDALSTRHLVDRVDAIVLTGGSAFGLDAAGGELRWMEERGKGLALGGAVVPIVPAAVVFDLGVGDSRVRPGAAEGYPACEQAAATVPEGSAGAGSGCAVG